jgi:hypothetical protein
VAAASVCIMEQPSRRSSEQGPGLIRVAAKLAGDAQVDSTSCFDGLCADITREPPEEG